MSYELHPPIEADKGTAILDVVEGLDAVCFIGDDVGDAEAFDALDRLAEGPVHVVRIAVAGAETPSELLARADWAVEGPTQALNLLRELVAGIVAGTAA
jgi:trehalose-6-phosphatase